MVDKDEIEALAEKLYAAADELNWNVWSFDKTAWRAMARKLLPLLRGEDG